MAPNVVDVHIYLGSVLIELNNTKEAAVAIEKALVIDPKNELAWFGRARVLSRTGKPAQGIQLMLTTIRDHPDWVKPDPYWHTNTARLAVQIGTSQMPNALPAGEQKAFRLQGLSLLHEDLSRWKSNYDADPTARRAVTHNRLTDWLTEDVLLPVRGVIPIGLLPADERDAWRKFWIEVRSLHETTAPPKASAKT